jgi:hypothetical protein
VESDRAAQLSAELSIDERWVLIEVEVNKRRENLEELSRNSSFLRVSSSYNNLAALQSHETALRLTRALDQGAEECDTAVRAYQTIWHRPCARSRSSCGVGAAGAKGLRPNIQGSLFIP